VTTKHTTRKTKYSKKSQKKTKPRHKTTLTVTNCKNYTA